LEQETDARKRVAFTNDILGIANELHHALAEEKNTVIDKVNVLLRERIDVETKAKKLVDSREVVTLDDVNADLRTLTRPEEVIEYVIALQTHPAFLGNKCEATLPRLLALYQRRSRKRERELQTVERKKGEREKTRLLQRTVMDPFLTKMTLFLKKKPKNIMTALKHSSKEHHLRTHPSFP